MKLRTFIVAALAFGLIFALFADAKSVKGKKKHKKAHKKQDAPSDSGAAGGGDAAGGNDAAAGGDDAAGDKPAGGDDAAAKPTPAPAGGAGAKPPMPGQPGGAAANPAPGEEDGSGSGGGGVMSFGTSPIVLGGHPHPGPPAEPNLMPAMPRQCEAPCPVECAPACMEWCCFPSIQAPPPQPASPVPAPLPYGPMAYNGIAGLAPPPPPQINSDATQMAQQETSQISQQMPMPGYKKHKIANQKSKSKKNKKDKAHKGVAASN